MGHLGRFKALGLDRHPAAGIRHPGAVGNETGLLRRNHVQHIGFVLGAKGGFHHALAGIDAHHLAIVRLLDPFDHVAVQRFVALQEQALLGESILVVQQQNFGFGFVLLEVVRHHRRPFVGAGRAAKRVGRNHHHKGAAVFHRLHLLAQQLGLGAGLPGVRGQVGGGLVVALQRIPAHVHTGGEHQLVVAQRLPAGQAHAAGGGIDILGAGMHHVDARFAQTVVAVADALERAQARQVQVGEGAGVKALGRLDQRHAHLGRLCFQVARSGGTAKAATDHHHMGGAGLGTNDGRQCQGGSPGQGAAQQGTALQAHGCTSWLNQAASAWICDSS